MIGGRSTMAAVRKVTDKRHNPVESICRKIRAIQKREDISDPVRQILKYQSSNFDSPQINTEEDIEEVLKNMATTPIPSPNTFFSSTSRDNAIITSPQIRSPRTPSISHLCSPENATYPVPLTSSEHLSRPRPESCQNSTSWASQTRKGEHFSTKDLNNHCENHFNALTLDFDSTSDKNSECLTPQESVVKKLSLNEAGSVGVAKIIDYLRQESSQNYEDSGLEKLWNILDPKKGDLHVDLEIFHAIMKEWMACCRIKW
ncbi:inositol 1,4,5-triphosphate receptor associated 2-like [Lutra lutra]|uniref:inositol 1,4,5-triphosphate receptor associated 2-like n=1 Tax=Lutra lutra TaxID=9657 RepID=UPI001FD52C1D|nr:inositol 1,4,5-triphosphate receptor associated 2-like [Lutra lutra]